MTAVALLSGGLDSTVATAAVHRRTRVVLALTADYGQRARAREIEAARRVCVALAIPHRVVPLPFIGEVSQTVLTRDRGELPQLSARDLEEGGAATHRSAALVWVPNRNGVLLNVAATFAEALDADEVIVGFNVEEAATFPDNSQAFVEAATRAMHYSTANHVRIVSPTAAMDKTEIVRLADQVDAPLRAIWSCYEAGPEHCNRCESCLRLERALVRAGRWQAFLDSRRDVSWL